MDPLQLIGVTGTTDQTRVSSTKWGKWFSSHWSRKEEAPHQKSDLNSQLEKICGKLNKSIPPQFWIVLQLYLKKKPFRECFRAFISDVSKKNSVLKLVVDPVDREVILFILKQIQERVNPTSPLKWLNYSYSLEFLKRQIVGNEMSAEGSVWDPTPNPTIYSFTKWELGVNRKTGCVETAAFEILLANLWGECHGVTIPFTMRNKECEPDQFCSEIDCSAFKKEVQSNTLKAYQAFGKSTSYKKDGNICKEVATELLDFIEATFGFRLQKRYRIEEILRDPWILVFFQELIQIYASIRKINLDLIREGEKTIDPTMMIAADGHIQQAILSKWNMSRDIPTALNWVNYMESKLRPESGDTIWQKLFLTIKQRSLFVNPQILTDYIKLAAVGDQWASGGAIRHINSRDYAKKHIEMYRASERPLIRRGYEKTGQIYNKCLWRLEEGKQLKNGNRIFIKGECIIGYGLPGVDCREVAVELDLSTLNINDCWEKCITAIGFIETCCIKSDKNLKSWLQCVENDIPSIWINDYKRLLAIAKDFRKRAYRLIPTVQISLGEPEFHLTKLTSYRENILQEMLQQLIQSNPSFSKMLHIGHWDLIEEFVEACSDAKKKNLEKGCIGTECYNRYVETLADVLGEHFREITSEMVFESVDRWIFRSKNIIENCSKLIPIDQKEVKETFGDRLNQARFCKKMDRFTRYCVLAREKNSSVDNVTGSEDYNRLLYDSLQDLKQSLSEEKGSQLIYLLDQLIDSALYNWIRPHKILKTLRSHVKYPFNWAEVHRILKRDPELALFFSIYIQETLNIEEAYLDQYLGKESITSERAWQKQDDYWDFCKEEIKCIISIVEELRNFKNRALCRAKSRLSDQSKAVFYLSSKQKYVLEKALTDPKFFEKYLEFFNAAQETKRLCIEKQTQPQDLRLIPLDESRIQYFKTKLTVFRNYLLELGRMDDFEWVQNSGKVILDSQNYFLYGSSLV